MSTLDRYITRQLIINTLLLLFMLFCFVVMVDVSLNAQRFLRLAGAAVREQAGEESSGIRVVLVAIFGVVDLWWPRLVQLYNYIIPLVLCGAVGFTYVQLVRHREVVAALAGGISLYRLARPVFLVALVFIGIQVLNQELLIPRIAPLIARNNTDVGKREFDTFPLRLVADGSRRLFLAGEFNPTTSTLTDLNVWERDETGKAVRRISADSARWDGSVWQLTNGRARPLGALDARRSGDPRLAPPVPVASLQTDLDPTSILTERYRAFSQSLSWGQIGRVLASPGVKPDVREQMVRIGMGRVSLIVCTFLTLVMVLPFFLVREPRNMLLQSLKAAPVAIGGIIGAVLGTATAIPGVPAEYGVFIPVLTLLPMAVGTVSAMRT